MLSVVIGEAAPLWCFSDNSHGLFSSKLVYLLTKCFLAIVFFFLCCPSLPSEPYQITFSLSITVLDRALEIDPSLSYICGWTFPAVSPPPPRCCLFGTKVDGIKLLVWPDDSGSVKIVSYLTVLLSLSEVSVPVMKGTVCLFFCVRQ